MSTRFFALAVLLVAMPLIQAQEFPKTMKGTITEADENEKKVKVGRYWYRVPSDCPVKLDGKKVELAAFPAQPSTSAQGQLPGWSWPSWRSAKKSG
jgi:hypothetical protein